MTQEDKELLVKDLSARLTYGVKGIITFNGDKDIFTIKGILNILFLSDTECCHIEDFKPYLLPLSSMTNEQQSDLTKFVANGIHGENILYDWYNKNHFDYRGLIEKGLALDATNLNIY